MKLNMENVRLNWVDDEDDFDPCTSVRISGKNIEGMTLSEVRRWIDDLIAAHSEEHILRKLDLDDPDELSGIVESPMNSWCSAQDI